jgi:hypothetical protein
MSRALACFGLCCSLLLPTGTAQAWELETHVGLTHQAALQGRLDAWLRERGLGSGLYETLALEPRARRAAREAERYALDDRGLLDELGSLDAALGVSPDGARQPALAWMLAGAALEGARMDRVRNHFLDPRHGGGLAERGPNGSERLRIDGARDGSGTVRGVFTGANFDGTGERADRWIESVDNPLSRIRLLDELERAAVSGTPAGRQAALARALVCMGALEHVLQAVGDPAHARGDFTVNYSSAGAPLEHWAAQRYGLSVPPAAPPGSTATRLAAFITAPDGSGLGDEVARAFVSPGTLPGMEGALPQPRLQPGPEPQGILAGPLVHELVVYRRVPGGVSYTLSPAALAEAAEVLLPRIARRSVQLLDFLLRGALVPSDDGGFRVGPLGLGRGHLTYLEEGLDGIRRVVISRTTEGGAPGTVLLTGNPSARGVLSFRGVDENGEPIALSAVRR